MTTKTRIFIGLSATVLIEFFIMTWVVRASLSLPSAKVELWPLAYGFTAPAWTFPLAGFLFGLTVLMLVATALDGDEDLLRGFSPVVIGAFLFALPGALAHEISFISGTVLVLLALGGLLAVSTLVNFLRHGDTIELQSTWGGLGGGMGGWRLSPAAGLLLLAVALVGAAAVAIQPPPKEKAGSGNGTAATEAQAAAGVARPSVPGKP